MEDYYDEGWSKEQDDLLLAAVQEYLRKSDDQKKNHRQGRHVVRVSSAAWDEIAIRIGKAATECSERLHDIHTEGRFFATIDDVWKKVSCSKLVGLDGWDKSKALICRSSAPSFERLHLSRDPRDPKEYVDASKGALLVTTLVGDSITTVNDELIPVDLFGQPIIAADKAHLLPKAREDAVTWNYPACAVMGFDMALVDTEVVSKAILGCTEQEESSAKKYPGIRNFLSNIVRMPCQGAVFDKNPFVLILPICDVQWARQWKGEGYDAIVLCETPSVANRIGMTNVTLPKTNRATLAEINRAVGLASAVCEFLALSLLQKSQTEVDKYQSAAHQAAHARFRSEKKISMPYYLSDLPRKSVFKVSFAGHNMQNPEKRHPSPDPMLLAFKSCNNWCRKQQGFRMLAGAEPEQEEDDLSEEGQRNLRRYLEWQAAQENSRRDGEIMNRFGGQGGVFVS